MNIVTVIGARPQFIKASIVSRALLARGVEEILLHTGQHFDANMSDVFFTELELNKPKYNLGIGGGKHGENTGRMLEGIEKVLLEERPDWVLIYGDTDSTLAGALAAVKLHIPVAHIEAGLRSFNRRMPEEINRVLADHIAKLLLVSTTTAVVNLAREGISGESVKLVGDVMYDAALFFGDKAQRESKVLSSLGLKEKKYILATVHRAENTDSVERLAAIMEAFNEISQKIPVVLPLHPRSRGAMQKLGITAETASRVRLIEPVGYLDMAQLEKKSALIATDSGGVQKEAFFYKVPCVTLRDETEWVELVSAGWNRITSPTSKEEIVAGILRMLGAQGEEIVPYGDGSAGQRCADCLLDISEQKLGGINQ